MAEIFLARQSGLQGFAKLVVIKRILPHLGSQQRFMQMFLDEARLAARFNHPNIVQIFDLGAEADSYFIAMEYVHGEDIKSIVRRCAKFHTKIPIEHVVKIFSGVLDGLHYAHSQKNLDGKQVGVVHRDVSPHNVLVSFEGGVKLVDFGIAKARSEITTTIPGRVKGKHAYMSPEQVYGEKLDGRSDVFAVGIIMYELLTWTRLFKRGHQLETLKAVTEDEIGSIRALNPNVDEQLEQIVLKALQRDLQQRYQSAQEMQSDLEDYLLNSGLRSNPILLSEFMAELFADKIKAREKALTAAKAINLEGALLGKSDQNSDLEEFLERFFADSSQFATQHAIDFEEASDSVFTPDEEATRIPQFGHPERREIPARAVGEYLLPRQAPPPKLPADIGLSAGLMPETETASPNLGQIPFAYEAPAKALPVDPSVFEEEIDPLGSHSKGRGVWVVLFLAAIVLGGVLLFVFKDELTTQDTPEFGWAKVRSIPGGADVFLNGKRILGQTPLELDNLKRGRRYRLKVSLPDLPAFETSFSIRDTTKALEIEAVLTKSASHKTKLRGGPIVAGLEGDGFASVQVDSQPPGARIFLDGVDTGKRTPALIVQVAKGLEHIVAVNRSGYRSGYERFQLTSDQHPISIIMRKGKDPQKKRHSVRFESEPEGASVYVNGYPMQKKTPLVAGLQAGKIAQVQLEKDGKKKSLSVRPIPAVELTVFVKF